MAIEKRGQTWWYRFTVRGTEYRKSTGLAAERSNLKDAEVIEARAKLEAMAGVAPVQAVSGSPFTAVAADFIRWCRSSEYRSKPSTALRIKTSFASLVAFFGDREVSSIDAQAVEDYKLWRIEKHGIRDITLRHDLHALSLFFGRYAVKRGIAAGNPVDEVSKPSDRDAIRICVLTPEMEAAYFAHARGSLYDVARLILLQGCRPEEILALQQVDIDLEAETMLIRGGKTRAARRTLRLVGESVEILERRLAKSDRWVFPSRRRPGQHLTKLNAQHDRACIDAGVSFCLYDLRHTFATRMVTEVKADIATVAAILGQSGLRTITRYVHPTTAVQSEAMAKYEELLKPKLRRIK